MKACMTFFVAWLMMGPNIYAQSTITLNVNDKGRVFEGIGAVSAGASSRNLVDYPAVCLDPQKNYFHTNTLRQFAKNL